MRWAWMIILGGCAADPVHVVALDATHEGTPAVDIVGIDGDLVARGWGENDLSATVSILAPGDARTEADDQAAIAGLETDLVPVFAGLTVLHALLPSDLPEGYSLLVELRVPYDYHILASGVTGDIRVLDVGGIDLLDEHGTIDVRHVNGPVRVTDDRGEVTIVDVHGSVDVVSGEGPLLVRNVTGDVSVSSPSDDLVVVNVGGEILVE